MRRVADVLRLKFDAGLSDRAIGQSLGVPRTTVRDYVRRFQASGLAWPLAPALDEDALQQALFRRRELPPSAARPLPDWALLHTELKRKGVTLQLLWQEYREREPTGYGYSQFAVHYKAWLDRVDPVLRQPYKAGERALVDYAGVTMEVVDLLTGELRAAEIFVAALGASNYTYAEATWTQQLPDWIAAHVRAVEYFGGAPALWVSDNLKAGVTKPCYYEPSLNPTYAEFASHYGSAILPTRVKRPRDKAKVETAVQIVEREILAPLRRHTFTSLADLNAAIGERLERLNTRPFQKLEGSRRALLESLERPALKPLPADRYEYAEYRHATVNIDYHIAAEKHFYSVPYHLVREKVLLRLTATTLEVLHKGKRVAVHARSAKRGGVTTNPDHRPQSHQRHLAWTPSRLIRWGESIGTATAAVIAELLRTKPHPEQGYRACLGLFSLGKRYGHERLEGASARALKSGAVSYRSIQSILTRSLDRAPLTEPVSETRLPRAHPNIRGREYYARDTAGTACQGATEGPPGLGEARSPLTGPRWDAPLPATTPTTTDTRR